MWNPPREVNLLMFIPAVYAVALAMIVLSMICWGSWANTQKLCKGWRVELFYWDYVWGILLMALILGFTLGARLLPARIALFKTSGLRMVITCCSRSSAASSSTSATS